MSRFATDFAADAWPSLAEEFGLTGDYWAPGASEATVSGLKLIVQEGSATVEFEGPEEMAERSAELQVSSNDLGTPLLDGLFVVGSDTWKIITPPIKRAGIWQCQCRWVARESIGKVRR